MVLNLINAVRAIVIVQEATKRKPSDFKGLTFFGEHDLWNYQLNPIDTTCESCRELARNSPFQGLHIRSYFSYLEIVSNDVMLPNVHPHCRCFLIRVERLTGVLQK